MSLERGRRVLAHLAEPGVAEDALKDLVEVGVLDAHQVIGVAAASHPEIAGLCLFDEQGLGKTITTLFAFHRLRQLDQVTKMLVICPKNMLLEWVRDAERFFGTRYAVQPVAGAERDKRSCLNRAADVYVTNYETPVRLGVRMRELLQGEGGRALLVVDESFFVKNPGAQRTLALQRLRRHVRRCIVLCGTPAPNSPHDIVEQMNLADGGAAFRGVAIPEDRVAARPVIQRVVQERGLYLRRLKQEVLPSLPGKTFHRVLVPFQPQQERAYVAALEGMIHNLRAADDVTFKRNYASFLAQRSALIQICSCPGQIVDGYQEIPAKVLALDEILEELIARRGEKVVLWSFFTASLSASVTRYARFNPVRVDGSVADVTDRREAVRRFQEDDDAMLFVGNPAAAGAGLTLHRARYSVYESMSNQAAHYFQSLDRIHRRGQTRDTEYLVLLCDRSIEISEYERLLAKEQASQILLGDRVEPAPTRETMLREATSARDALRPARVPQRSAADLAHGKDVHDEAP